MDLQERVGRHYNPERFHWSCIGHTQKVFENENKLGDDALTIEEITTPRNLDTSIWEHLYRLRTVCIVVGKCDLIVKCSWLQFPFKSIRF